MSQTREQTAAAAANPTLINVSIANSDAGQESADTAKAILQRAVSALEQGKLIEKVVLPDLNRALELDKKLAADVYFWRGVCYERLMQLATSSATCTPYLSPKITKSTPNVFNYVMQAFVNFHEAALLNPQRVLDRFNTVEQSDNLFAIFCCGYAYYYLGKVKPEAEHAFHRVLQSEDVQGELELHPYIKASALHWLQHCASSYIHEYTRAPSEKAIQQKNLTALSLYLIQQACILFYIGKIDAAKEYLKQAHIAAPLVADHDSHYEACLGLIELNEFNTKQGKEHLEIAYKRNPKNFMANAGLAYLAYLQDDQTKAAEFLRAMFEYYPHAKSAIEGIDLMVPATEPTTVSLRKKLLLSRLSAQGGDIRRLSIFTRFLLLEVLLEPESLLQLTSLSDSSWLREDLSSLLRQDYDFDSKKIRIAKFNVFLLSLCQAKPSIPSVMFIDPASTERRLLLEHWEQGIADMTPADVYPHVLDALKEEARVNPEFLLPLNQLYTPIKRFLVDVFRANSIAVAVPAEPSRAEIMAAAPSTSPSSWWNNVSRLFSSRNTTEQYTAADDIIYAALARWKKGELGDLPKLAELFEMDFANVTAAITKAMQTITQDEPAVMSMLFFYQGMVLALARRFTEAYSAFMMVEACNPVLCKRHPYFSLFKAYAALGRADLAADTERPAYWNVMADQCYTFRAHAIDAIARRVFVELWKNISQNQPLQEYLSANRAASFRTLQSAVEEFIYPEEKNKQLAMPISQFMFGNYYMANASFEKVAGKVNYPPFLVCRFLSYLADSAINSEQIELAFKEALEKVASADFAILLLERLDRLPLNAVAKLFLYCKQIPGFDKFVAKRDELFFAGLSLNINHLQITALITTLNRILLLNDKHVGAYVYRYMTRLYHQPLPDEPMTDLQTALALSDKETVAKHLMEIQKLYAAYPNLREQRYDEIEPGANDLAFQIGAEFLQAKNYTAARSFYTAVVPSFNYAARVGFCLALTKYLQAKELASLTAGKRYTHRADDLRQLPESKLIADLMVCLQRVATHHPGLYKDIILKRTADTRTFLAGLLGSISPSLDAALLVFAAKVHERANLPEETESCYKAAIQADPSSAVALNAYCDWLFTLKYSDKLENVVRTVLAEAKGITILEYNSQPVVEIAFKWLGKCHAAYYQPAVDIVEATTENAKIFLYRGVAYCHAKQWKNALHYIEQAIKLDPSLEDRASLSKAIAYYQIHGLYHSLNEEEFRAIYNKFMLASQIYPWQLGKWLKRTPFTDNDLYTLISAMRQLCIGETDKAVSSFKYLLRNLDEEEYTFITLHAHCGLHIALQSAGRADEDVKAMRAAISASSSIFGPGTYTKYLYYRMAAALFAEGKWREASHYINKDELYRYDYGYYYLRQEEIWRAQTLIEAMPEPYLLSKAYLFLHLGFKETALQALNLYLQRFSGDVRARLLRGRLLCEPGSQQDLAMAAGDFAVILRSETYAHPRYILAAQTQRYLHYKQLPYVANAKPVFAETDADQAFLACIEQHKKACGTNADGVAVLIQAYTAIGEYEIAKQYATQLVKKYDFYCLDLLFRADVSRLLAEPRIGVVYHYDWRFPLGLVPKEIPTPAVAAASATTAPEPPAAAAATVAPTLAQPRLEPGTGFLPWSSTFGFVRPVTAIKVDGEENASLLTESYEPHNAL